MSLVVDNSITVAWCIPDEQTPEIVAFLQSVRFDTLLVPLIWPAEFTNAMMQALAKRRIEEERLRRSCKLLAQLDIQVRSGWDHTTLRSAFELSSRFKLTPYDASYLALALKEGSPLTTGDEDLRAAARSAGVPLVI